MLYKIVTIDYRMVYLSVYIETYGESNFKHVLIKTRINRYHHCLNHVTRITACINHVTSGQSCYLAKNSVSDR